jgi:ubiquinone biosynthesis protein
MEARRRTKLAPRYLRRYRQIANVLARHGFGGLSAQLALDQRLSLPRRLFRREQAMPAIIPAEHLRLALEELGPTFVKFGQILSTRPDLIPPDYITELSRLQDEAQPVAWEAIKKQIESELDVPLDQLFSTIDPVALAAASLSQVHVARLLDGREAVVKVQRPSIEQTIDLDLDILHDLARLTQEKTRYGEMYDLVDITEEFAATLRSELDYQLEGQNADRFRANFATESHVYVPRIYWEYTTRRVLIMERIRGIKINDIAALDAAGHDRHQVAQNSAAIIVKEVLEDGFFHADPHPGNYIVMPGEVIGVMDFGMVGHLETAMRLNLVRLFVAVIQLDNAGIVRYLVRMGIADHRLDEQALSRDLLRVLRKYRGVAVKEINAREVVDEISPIAYRHHLRLPGDLWMFGKTLAMMEGVGLKLDPDFDIFAVSQPYVRSLQRRLLQPSIWGPPLLRGVFDWVDLATDFPGQASGILNQLEEGRIELRLKTPDLEDATSLRHKISSRLTLSILLAALMIALALLMPTLDLTKPWTLLTWLVVLGFGASIVFGLWLTLSILGSELKRR